MQYVGWRVLGGDFWAALFCYKKLANIFVGNCYAYDTIDTALCTNVRDSLLVGDYMQYQVVTSVPDWLRRDTQAHGKALTYHLFSTSLCSLSVSISLFILSFFSWFFSYYFLVQYHGSTCNYPYEYTIVSGCDASSCRISPDGNGSEEVTCIIQASFPSSSTSTSTSFSTSSTSTSSTSTNGTTSQPMCPCPVNSSSHSANFSFLLHFVVYIIIVFY